MLAPAAVQGPVPRLPPVWPSGRHRAAALQSKFWRSEGALDEQLMATAGSRVKQLCVRVAPGAERRRGHLLSGLQGLPATTPKRGSSSSAERSLSMFTTCERCRVRLPGSPKSLRVYGKSFGFLSGRLRFFQPKRNQEAQPEQLYQAIRNKSVWSSLHT